MMLSGEVVDFDGTKGLGTVRGENGVDYLFHVIEITDGTRTVELGQQVRFQPLPKFGRFQAGQIRKV
jgi:cold shock CspA family protein